MHAVPACLDDELAGSDRRLSNDAPKHGTIPCWKRTRYVLIAPIDTEKLGRMSARIGSTASKNQYLLDVIADTRVYCSCAGEPLAFRMERD